MPQTETDKINETHNKAMNDFKTAKHYLLEAELINPNDELLITAMKAIKEILHD